LVALHGWGEQAADFVEPWRPAANAGLLVAVPESSHELTPGFFVWGDRERARDDVARALSSLRREWDLDEERGLYAGFSQGGGLAVSWALADARKLHETLRRGGVSFDLHVVPGLGHDLPDDLDERLTEALHLLLPLT
ncbi:MAG TPA: hypothetical protein VJ787_05710, partial [Thermoleophilia bacterium]|nr:hypothetical protein [Thermoleophilia bacterium]